MIIHDYRFAVEHHCKYHCAGQAILGTTLSLYEPSDQPQIVKKQMSTEEVVFSETEIGHMLRGFERTSQVPMTWGPACKQSGYSESRAREREIKRDRYAGQKKVALNKCSSFLTVNPKSKFKEPSLHWSNSLIKQPVDIDVYYDTKTKNRTQTKKIFCRDGSCSIWHSIAPK